MAQPFRTNQELTLAPSALTQSATTRRYLSLPWPTQRIGRDFERNSSSANAASLPQRYGLPAASRQTCQLSGASFPPEKVSRPNFN
jgi:hypothetical protein